MLDAALRKDLVELIGSNFNADQINTLGRYVIPNFDVHTLRGTDRHITVPALQAARTLVEASESRKQVEGLLEVLIETDGERLDGRRVTVDGMEEFLAKMARSGILYDYDRRKVRRGDKDAAVAPNWGSLRDGRSYPVTVAGIDIVGNSELVRRNGIKLMEKAYYRFWSFLNRHLGTYNGRTWSWAGDGGVVAFALKNSEVRATMWALEVQATLPIFNAGRENPIPQDISARIGIDCGRIRFRQETGRIVSDTINFAAHLEKEGTSAGHVSISDEVFQELHPKLARFFVHNGIFEDRDTWVSVTRMDQSIVEDQAG